jgi:hypothetical protein
MKMSGNVAAAVRSARTCSEGMYRGWREGGDDDDRGGICGFTP